EPAGRRGQHLTALELRHVRSGTLPKADQGTALLAHELSAEARAAPVAPDGTGERGEPVLGADARDAFEVLAQLLLLQRQLRRRLQVLQRAAPAHPEVRAARLHARGGGVYDLQQLCLIVLAVPSGAPEAHDLPRQSAGDEGRLAAVHPPLARVREAGDGTGLLSRRRARAARKAAQAGDSQARRNSPKCGSRAACKEALRRARS